MTNFIGGVGPANAKLAIVGEAPGYEEDLHGVPFYPEAPCGRMLTDLLRECGVNRNDVYITNCFKYRPPENNIKNIHLVCNPDEQIELLWKELNTLKPNAILALGGTALKVLTGKNGINKYRGSILQGLKSPSKIIPGIHPGNIINPRGKDGAGPQWKYILKLDIRRAIQESRTSDFNLPRRTIEIIKSSHQLYKFLQQYKDKFIVSLDIETDQSIPYCIGLAFHPYHAAVIPLFSLKTAASKIDIEPVELYNIWHDLSKFLSRPEIKFIGQNFKFDHEKLIAPSKLIKWERGKLHADTSLMAGLVYAEFPKKLEFLTSIFTREPYYKDEGKEFNPRRDKIEQKLIYCGKDVTTTFEVYEALKRELQIQGTTDFYFNFVNRFHDMYLEMEAEGVEVDDELRKKLLENYEADIKSEYNNLVSLIGQDININSPKQISVLLFTTLKLPYRDNTQEDTLVALLGNHTEDKSKERQVLNSIMTLRQLDTNAGYLRAETDYDGRHRTSVRITGTETGRTSNSILKPPTRPTKCGLPFQTLPKHGPYSKVIRSIFISRESHYLLAVDMRQAEARITSFLANDDEAVKEFDTIDVYKKAASICMSRPIEEINSEQRYVGKKVRLSFGYGIGKHKAMLDINSEAKKAGININISEKEAGTYLERLHRAYPNIQRIYHKEVMTVCIRDKRTLWNPFGRPRTFYGILKNEEVYANIPQSTVPDHLRRAYFKMEEDPLWDKTKISLVMERHDEMVFRVSKGYENIIAPVIKREMEVAIDFAKCSLPRGNLSIPCEITIGTNFRDMNALK